MKNLPTIIAQLPKILSIDTTCDETSVAVTAGRYVLSNVIASQAQLHKQFGGVFPTLAKQQHQENISPTTKMALQRAGVEPQDLKAVAVTLGPGLAPALEVGISFAEEFARANHLPLIAINHMEGHALSALALPVPKKNPLPSTLLSEDVGSEFDLETSLPIARRSQPKLSAPAVKAANQGLTRFPVLAVTVSGGHTEFTLIKALGCYERVGWTVDDAAGEALDKFGRMVELGYPAGSLVEHCALQGDDKTYHFPVPMTTSGNSLMSFSGLKTAARRKIEELTLTSPLSKQQVYDLCASFQYAVFHAICYKLNTFLRDWEKTNSQQQLFGVWLGGGVAANMTLRRMLRKTLKPFGLKLSTPYSLRLCGDNAAMIGIAAGLKLNNDMTRAISISSSKVSPTGLLERRPRWEIDEA